MPTNQQRRAAERHLLQRQLEERRVKEAARKRFTLIASIIGTVVVIAAVVIGIVVAGSGDSGGTKNAGGRAVSFQGVTVKHPTDLTQAPGVTSKSSTPPPKLEYKDLVVGKGNAASPTSSVTVQYTGVLYEKGTTFDSSWGTGKPAQFSLARVVPGFTQGIGGNSPGVPPMRIGGRRIVVLPSALGYGAQAQQSIPANSPLVFVIDLKKIGS